MRKLIEKLRRDSWGMGIFLGIAAPALTFGLLYGLFAAVLAIFGLPVTETLNKDLILKIVLLAIVPSVFILRYYLMKLKYDLTGRGILLVTFIIAIVFAIFQFAV
ncbi:MAG: hypothetical protein J5642_03565 [Bacteroidales bacterium]|nr:hypothetical protein [Bacteroidales bacterium]